ncbi:hypothetical protein FA13DRAFT_1709677 [Coprinellus micaceus]|uniref:Uncharacterized protein n=1 Tax=Coprinellus micaceus TaxID=71717 RepID=A0A4Y7TCD8_COPMI|nr:hypothetical protein FA13DRAFT_1709677 [Coprinellus micaceus]
MSLHGVDASFGVSSYPFKSFSELLVKEYDPNHTGCSETIRHFDHIEAAVSFAGQCHEFDEDLGEAYGSKFPPTNNVKCYGVWCDRLPGTSLKIFGLQPDETPHHLYGGSVSTMNQPTHRYQRRQYEEDGKVWLKMCDHIQEAHDTPLHGLSSINIVRKGVLLIRERE